MADKTMLEPGDQAPSVTLLDTSGEPVALEDLWKQRPLALLFLRHLGCPFSRSQACDMSRDYQSLQEVGGLAVVTMSSVAETANFVKRLDLPFLCLADPERAAYQAFAVPRGSLTQVAGPAVWSDGLRAVMQTGLGRPTGDIRQLHAAFVIDSGGRVKLAHYPENSADTINAAAFIAAMSD